MGNTVHPPNMARRNAFSSLINPSGKRKYLTSQERARFVAASNTQPLAIRAFCLLLVLTGCRISEALALRGTAINFDQELVVIRCLKKRGRVVFRQVPVPAFWLNLFRVDPLQLPCDLDTRLWRWERTHAWQLIKTVMRVAGINGAAATPRGLRHTFGTHAVLSGVALTLVQKWMGHDSLETTAIYTQIVGDEERRQAHKMWD